MLGENERKIYKAFFDEIPPCLTDGTNDATISYLALAQGPRLVVVAARMTLGDDLSESNLPQELRTANVRAGYFRLKQLGQTVEQYLGAALARGSIEIPDDTLYFPQNTDGGHGAWYKELSEVGVHANKRVSVLSLFGGRRESPPAPEALDWELKAATPPFDGLEDLAQVYRFGPVSGGTITFDVVAPEAVEVLSESNVLGDTARIVLMAKYELDHSAVSLRVRIVSHGQTVERLTIHAGDIEFLSDGTPRGVGISKVKVREGATVHCTAVYAGRAQHERTIVDQAARENVMRIAFETADRGLVNLRAFLASGEQQKTPGRNLEFAISWLLSMLGFQVIHLGVIDALQDGVDVIACSPSGGLLIIECTTDVLKDDKTSKLVSRAAKTRRNLTASGFAAVSVIPVMLTTVNHDQVEPRIGPTETNGVLVMTKQQVEEWVELSAAAPDADREFVRLERRLLDAQARMSQTPQISDSNFL